MFIDTQTFSVPATSSYNALSSTELDLHTTVHRWKDPRREIEKKKRNVVFVPLNSSLKGDAFEIVFLFLFGFTEMVCVYTHYRGLSGCMCSTIVCSIVYIQAKLLDVCTSTIVCIIIYLQSKLLIVTTISK